MEKLAPSDRLENGPFDVSEVGLLTPYLDFGSIRVAPMANMQIRADVEEASKRLIAITLEIESHRIQMQAFAASKTEGLWQPTLDSIEASLVAQGGSSSRWESELGVELLAQVPFEENGRRLLRESRFIGVDGPKWFLRGVLTGPEMHLSSRRDPLIAAFRAVAVSRGNVPMPPGELLPLTLPGAVT
ncbi:MAG: DUF3710 domain-containing protein [Aquiluna sp.]|nr:DUF3710 domain-containing protein [Aquiluna sp.]MCF8545126.1 DUF3710 domain-containing protein [Aquiluna sp.]